MYSGNSVNGSHFKRYGERRLLFRPTHCRSTRVRCRIVSLIRGRRFIAFANTSRPAQGGAPLPTLPQGIQPQRSHAGSHADTKRCFNRCGRGPYLLSPTPVRPVVREPRGPTDSTGLSSLRHNCPGTRGLHHRDHLGDHGRPLLLAFCWAHNRYQSSSLLRLRLASCLPP